MRNSRKLSLAICLVLVAVVAIVPMLAFTAFAADTEVTFEFGANGSATHADGSSKTSYSETVSGYTLEITGGTSMYTGARDAKGNSCIKLGTSSKTGGFSFTVPSDVTKVVINVAGYKATAAKLTINGTSYTTTKVSNNGAYDAITVDTTSTKTVTLTTVSGGLRAMVNSITFVVSSSGDSSCEHTNTTTTTTDATCTENGFTTITCDDCGAVTSNITITATGHKLGEWSTIDSATCTETGSKTATCTVCGAVETDTIPATGHSYENGACTVCGEDEPNYKTLTFDNTAKRTEFTTSVQVWEENEITLTNDKASSTNSVADYANPARFYKGSSITVKGKSNIAKIEFACNNTTYATALKDSITDENVEVVIDGKIVTVTLKTPASSFTIDNLSGGQVRMDSLTVYYVEGADECDHINTEPTTIYATCAKDGEIVTVCKDCGEITNVEILNALGHDHVNGVCTRCNHLENIEGIRYIAVKLADDTAYRFASYVLNSNRFTIFKSEYEKLPVSITTPSAAYAFAIEANGDGTYYIKSMAIFGDNCYVGINSDNKIVYTDAASAAKVTIVDNNDGTYTITEESTGRNLGFNNQGYDYCSWYKTGAETNINLVAVAEGAEVAMPKIATATVTIGTNLAMNYTVDLPAGYVIDGMYMVFTMNGVSVTVKENDTNVFTYTRLAPQCMGDSIKAELYAKDGALIDVSENFSVKAYAEKLLELNPGDAELATLVADMLNYGAAAQKYVGYKTDALVNAGYETAGSNAEPTESDMTVTESSNANFGIISAGVRFDYVNQIYVKFGIRAAALEGAAPTVVIAFNGVEQTVTLNGEGEYIAYSGAISALEFGKVYTIELKVDGEVVQTLEYSVNSYVFAKKDGNNAMAELAIALYRYGNSAVAYSEK